MLTAVPDKIERDDEWTIVRTLGPVPFPAWDYEGGTEHTIRATCQLHKIRGNERPYFSATADIHQGQKDVGGGAMTEEIVSMWPEAAVVTRLHLSDDAGVPHAVKNARYWMGLTAFDPADKLRDGRTPDDVLRDHLRISETERRSLVAAVDRKQSFTVQCEQIDVWLCANGIRDRWEREAAEALAFILEAS